MKMNSEHRETIVAYSLFFGQISFNLKTFRGISCQRKYSFAFATAIKTKYKQQNVFV